MGSSSVWNDVWSFCIDRVCSELERGNIPEMERGNILEMVHGNNPEMVRGNIPEMVAESYVPLQVHLYGVL